MKLDKFKILSDIIGILALIIGGFFAGYQYLDKLADDRIRETLLYVERFNKSPFYDIRHRIDKVWLDNSKELDEVLQPKSSYNQYSAFVLQSIYKQKIELDVMNLIDFFEALGICSTNRICDDKIAHAFFGNHAKEFYHLHYPYIEQKRKDWNDPSFAKELETFAKSGGK